MNVIDDCGFVEAIIGFTVLLLDNMNGLATNFERESLFDKNCCASSKRSVRYTVRGNECI